VVVGGDAVNIVVGGEVWGGWGAVGCVA
jgi:hypothetical protein